LLGQLDVAVGGGGPGVVVGAVVTVPRERLGDRHHLAVVGPPGADPGGGDAGELVVKWIGEELHTGSFHGVGSWENGCSAGAALAAPGASSPPRVTSAI